MGRLSGFSYHEVARKLRAFGFVYYRHGRGSHEVWRQENTGKKVTMPHHSRELPEGTLRAILREAGIEVEDFLNA